MKKFKKLSVLLAGAMTLSCVSIMPVSAAEPAASRVTLLSQDFEDESVKLDVTNNSAANNSLTRNMESDAENHFGTWKMNSTYRSGFKFNEGVISGKLHVKFDFMTEGKDNWRGVALWDSSNSKSKLGLTLLAINHSNDVNENNERSISVGGRKYASSTKGELVKNGQDIVTAAEKTWYTYEGIIDLNKKTIDMTLKERGKDKVIGSCTTGSLKVNSNEWEEWPLFEPQKDTDPERVSAWPTNAYTCDSIAVTCANNEVPLSLDNIEIWTERNTSFKEDFEGDAPTIYDASNGSWSQVTESDKFQVGFDGENNIGEFHSGNSSGYRSGFDIGTVASDGKVSIHFKFRAKDNATTIVVLGNEYEQNVQSNNNQQHYWLGLLTAKKDNGKRYLYAGTGHGGALLVADGHHMKAPDGSDASIEEDVWYTYDALLDVDKHDLQAVVTNAEGAIVGSIDLTNMPIHNGTDSNARFHDWPAVTDFKMLASMYKSDLDDIDIEAEPTTPKVTAKSSDGALGNAECEQNGLVATLTAEPLNGSTFDGWYIGDGQDPVSTDLKYTVNAAALEGDTEYTAKFTAKEEPTPTPAEDVTATIAALDEKDGNTFDIGFEFEALDPSDYANIVFTVDGQTRGGKVDEVLKTVVNGPALIAIILEDAPSKDAKVTFTNQDTPPVKAD